MASDYFKLDIDNIIKVWAINMLKICDLPPNDISEFVLDYSKVTFSDLEPIYHGIDQGTPCSEVLHEVVLRNDTDRDQSMSLRTTKSSTTMAKFDLKSVIVADGKTKLNVSQLPGVITSRFPNELNMETVGCQKEFIEKLEWQIDNTVNVGRRSTVRAAIIANEKSYEGRFSVNTEIGGEIHVYMFNPNKNLKLYSTANIATILKKYNKDVQRLIFKENNTALFVSEGVCKFRFGINYNVNLETLE